MKLTQIKSIACVALVAATTLTAAGQNRSAYFIENYTYGYQMNPALSCPRKGEVSFPGLGNLNLGVNGNVSVKDFIYQRNGRNVTFMHPDVSAKEAMGNFSNSNRLGLGIREGILNVGFRGMGGYNHISINAVANAEFSIPKGLFAFFKEGISNRNYEIGRVHAHADAYAEIALQHSHSLDKLVPGLTIGAAFKFLVGFGNFDLNLDRADVNLGTNAWVARTNGTMQMAMGGFRWQQKLVDGQLRVDGIDTDNFSMPSGYGCAFDLGATYKFKDDWTFGLAFTDLGFINWKHNRIASTNGEHTFSTNDYTFDPDDMDATMGCRTRVFENRYGEKTSVGRGNLSFTTINIVRIAIELMNIQDQNERVERFFSKLDEVLDITARQLNDRYNFQKTALVKQFPLLMSRLWNGAEKLGPNDTIESVINQGTLGIGFIGLAECLVALTGKHHGESDEAQKLGIRIVSHMRSRANEYSEEYGHNYSVLATPAEGLSGRFTRGDRKTFGVIPGVTDRDYYTNSNHVPVYYHCSPRHKAQIEAPYHELTRGGHIFYVEIDGDATHNPQAISDIVDLMDKYNIGYGSVNHNRNRCMDCGYEDATEGLEECPKCHSHNIDRLQRITGYLVGTTDRWNSAKLAELRDRVVHK